MKLSKIAKQVIKTKVCDVYGTGVYIGVGNAIYHVQDLPMPCAVALALTQKMIIDFCSSQSFRLGSMTMLCWGGNGQIIRTMTLQRQKWTESGRIGILKKSGCRAKRA